MANEVEISDFVISTIGLVALEAAETALIARYPFLGLPVIRQIWQFFASKLEKEIVMNLQKGSADLIIDFKTDAEAKDAKLASDKLKAVQGDQGSTAQQISDAQDAFKDAYRKLIRGDTIPSALT